MHPTLSQTILFSACTRSFQPPSDQGDRAGPVVLGKRAERLAHWRGSGVQSACGAGGGVLILVPRILHRIIRAHTH
eukprot:2604960-Pleurochrysis_carterae.AAC.3